MIKTLTLYVCIAWALLLGNPTHLQAQQLWTFDTSSPFLSTDGSLSLVWHSVKEHPELSPALTGLGLRTDGYSTYLEATLPAATPGTGLSGCFALESYPTDTAAFFGIQDKDRQATLTLCVDRFGTLLLGKGQQEHYTYYPLNCQVDRFRWFHLALCVRHGEINLFLNGTKVQVPPAASITPIVEFDHILWGRDFRIKEAWGYNLTHINGLMDNLAMLPPAANLPLLQKEWQQEAKSFIHKAPELAIPASRFVADFNRPRYHLLPSANWTNETHGLIYYKGKYHIFNQKNASNIMLRQINWGHFSSPDLLHWTEHKPALSPDQPYDKNGIWSGCAVLDNEGIPRIIYTAGGDKMGMAAASPKDDNLIEWEKYSGNPLISGQPDNYARTDLRDPYVWKEGNLWYMIIGFGLQASEGKHGDHGAVLLYKSKDLEQWEYVPLLYEGNPAVDDSGIFWEMPVFQKIGKKYVLLVNKVPHQGIPARALYWIGDFKNEKFIPDHPVPRNLEIVNRLLSPSVLETPEGLITAIAIIPDEIGGKATYQQGWAHLYSIPRVWQLKDGKINQSPHPALKQLRGNKTQWKKRKINPGQPGSLSKTARQVEVKATFTPGNATKFGFVLYKNPDNSEYSRIYYDVETREIVVDQTRSSLRNGIPLQTRKGTYTIDTSQPVDFHIFVDGSVVEVFINNEDAFTTRIFPQYESSAQMELFAEGDTIEAEAEIWMLKDAKVKADF